MKRPTSVTIGLSILWMVLVLWAMGAYKRLSGIQSLDDLRDLWSFIYAAYLVGITVVPACLLVMIAYGRNWARIAAMMLQGLDFLWRLYLFHVIEHDDPSQLPYLFVPAVVQLFAYCLMCMPGANDWFRSERLVR